MKAWKRLLRSWKVKGHVYYCVYFLSMERLTTVYRAPEQNSFSVLIQSQWRLICNRRSLATSSLKRFPHEREWGETARQRHRRTPPQYIHLLLHEKQWLAALCRLLVHIISSEHWSLTVRQDTGHDWGTFGNIIMTLNFLTCCQPCSLRIIKYRLTTIIKSKTKPTILFPRVWVINCWTRLFECFTLQCICHPNLATWRVHNKRPQLFPWWGYIHRTITHVSSKCRQQWKVQPQSLTTVDLWWRKYGLWTEDS